MNAMVGALISALGFGTANVVAKKSLDRLTVPQTVTTCLTVSALILLPVVIWSGQFSEITGDLLWIGALLAMGEVSLYLIYHKAFAKSNATTVAAIVATYPLISLIYAVLFLRELISPLRIEIIVLLVLGTIVVSINWDQVKKDGFKRADLVKGLPWILVAMLAHGLYFPLLGVYTSSGLWELKLLIIKSTAVLFLVVVFVLVKRQKVVPPRSLVPFTSLLGIFEMIGWAGFSSATAVSTGQTAIIIAVLNSAALVTTILAYFWLKERMSWPQYVGIALIIISLTVIAL